MRFNSIEIKNYRQYRNLRFDFPTNDSYDLHIIIGKNTMGKTNVLNAINWCLYGDEPHLGMNSHTLPKLNLDAKKDAIANGSMTENVSVVIYAEDDGDLIRFERTMPYNVNDDFDLKEQFSVTVPRATGDSTILQGDEARAYVNKYMPDKIRKYFYFDGEQLDNYFIGEQSTRIKDSIHAISQVDIITRISTRLSKIINKKQNEAASKGQDIASLNSELTDIENSIDQYEEKITELKTQIDKSETIIKRNSEFLKGQEDVKEHEDNLTSLKQQYSNLEEEKRNMDLELFGFVKEYRILISFYQSIRKTLDIINEKESQNLLPPNIDKKILYDILTSHKCTICQHDLNDKDEAFIKELINQIQLSSSTSHLLIGIRNELERAVRKVMDYPSVKKSILDRHKRLEESMRLTETAMQGIENKLSQFSDKDLIISRYNERKDHERLLQQNNQKLGALLSQMDEATKRKFACEKKLHNAMARNARCVKISKSVVFLKKANDVAQSIEQEMMHEIKNQMESSTMKYFSKLNWRKDIYDRIELDDTYQLDLFHCEGYSCVGTCAASERSLLALSFTLALHEVSGFNALLFIDTPVARIADVNRTNFANVLKEVSKDKQIILAFTPDEYSEQIRNVLEICASTSVTLEMDEAKATGTYI